MKLRDYITLGALVVGTPLIAEITPTYYSDQIACCFGFDSALSYQVGGGYRRDQISWEAFDLEGEGTVTKEKWNNMGMGVVEAEVNFLACQRYLFNVDFNYAWFDTRKNQSIKTIDVETHDIIQKLRGHTKGQFYDLSGALGYQFNFDCFRLRFVPMVGWSYSHQFLKTRKYENTLDPDDLIYGKNNYKYRWNGPWVGFAAGYNICCEWLVYLDYRFHWVEYRGKVLERFFDLDDEQPEEDPENHIPHEETHPNQRAKNAYGNQVIVGTSYEFCDRWFLDIRFDYKGFWANKGHFTRDDVHHKVRNIDWTSYKITMDVGYTF